MMIVEILLALLLLVILLLVLPFSYSFSFGKWKLEIRISLLLGLISKRKTFSLHDEETSEEGEDSGQALEELDAALDALEERVKGREESSAEGNSIEKAAPLEMGKEEKRKEVPFSEKKSFREEEISNSGEKKGPSYLSQLCFALENGLAERFLESLSLLISHGFPKTLEFKGGLGLGDPMPTGVLCGMVYAFLPKAAEEIRWNYVDKECTLTGKSEGRLIPLYVLYILIKLALSKPAREFWHFRQGGNDNG
ncbi:hypothetical protein [Dialister succinatiphilus]|uniref:hypothetical protein n=1 Tax=Dialister succinatiphilus TaxID=487173 RepID=UPI003F7DDAB1